MSEPEEKVQIVLTPEQREMVRRMSGQNIDAIELEPEDTKKGGGAAALPLAALERDRDSAPAMDGRRR